MGLILVTGAVMVVSVLVACKRGNFGAGVVAGISICAFAAELLFLLVVSFATLANIVNAPVVYDELCYRLEQNAENDTSLYSDIQRWNEDVKVGKELSKNFWIGIYYPSALYDYLEVIEY